MRIFYTDKGCKNKKILCTDHWTSAKMLCFVEITLLNLNHLKNIFNVNNITWKYSVTLINLLPLVPGKLNTMMSKTCYVCFLRNVYL